MEFNNVFKTFQNAVKRNRLKHEAIPHFEVLQENLGDDSTNTITTERDETRASTSRAVASSTTDSSSTSKVDQWQNSNNYFEEVFLQNNFGEVCDVCDRLWFARDLKMVTIQQANGLV